MSLATTASLWLTWLKFSHVQAKYHPTLARSALGQRTFDAEQSLLSLRFGGPAGFLRAIQAVDPVDEEEFLFLRQQCVGLAI